MSDTNLFYQQLERESSDKADRVHDIVEWLRDNCHGDGLKPYITELVDKGVGNGCFQNFAILAKLIDLLYAVADYVEED